MSQDVYESCVRAKGWELAADPSSVQDVDALCADNLKLSRTWQLTNAVLLSYVASLGSLATNRATDYGIQGLASAIASAPGSGLSADKTAAIAGAANSLIGADFAGQRRDALLPIMRRAEAPYVSRDVKCPQGCLQELIDVLKSTARTYATQLSLEDTAIYAFYAPNISAGLGVRGISALTAFSYEENEAKARQAVAVRRASISTYLAALDQIADTHHNVLLDVQSNNLSDIAGTVAVFYTTFSAKLSALKAVYP